MSYADQSRRSSPASIAAVVGVHLAIGYALLSGLAYTVFHPDRTPTIVTEVPNDPPPPPPNTETPRTKLPTPRDIQTAPEKPTDQFKIEETPLFIPPLDGASNALGGGGGPDPTPLPQPKPGQARDAVPVGDRLRWITTEDYPSAALRQGMQGVVVISAMIGADGKVQSCVVAQSSGSQLLDDTTCRLYTRRARFTPARDADGNATTAQRSDRFRWQIPNE